MLRSRLSEHLASGATQPFVVFDVGANAGDYTGMLLDLATEVGCPVQVHAFEPAPFNIERLQVRFGAEPRVTLVPAAVGDEAGTASLYAGGAGSPLASLVPRKGVGQRPADPVPVPIIRLGDYLAETGLERVHFLKLDVEGWELAALRGLGRALKAKCCDTIQFEYGGTTLDAGTTLRDLFIILEAAGYLVTKLFPRALEAREYHGGLEHFTYANYVAILPPSPESATMDST